MILILSRKAAMNAPTLTNVQRRRLAERAGLDPDKVTDTAAAIGIALSLMQGDPETFKAGYTAPNALLASLEIFPDADKGEVSRQIGIGCEICGRDDLACRSLSGLPECQGSDVVVIEDRVGHFEFGPLVEKAKVLTADHIELTIPALIQHALRTYPDHTIIVVEEEDWSSARGWLEDRLGNEDADAALEAMNLKIWDER